eukprot:CAMPEP_0184342600 /NCGR_PEP_ID=MMETSP1089-20130417/11202_1 /TAXON_ID=38269 ORGANISM="Gloeochaete wittrockiana, Strain SAG46.84" /NCGR_SAMPLE_ID=MMETSP1089 /ASSEMBLY_ACC=CAM_ASM_000445 /LENGTH=226 /DNA_ID=CAMNT_0026671539 /DNA_START=217 /DNA_END=897 /DNA_ORIENTATION=-
MPRTLDEMIEIARATTRKSLASGEKRLLLQLPLPLTGASDLDDWPGGIQQQFLALRPIVKQFCQGLFNSQRTGRFIDADDAVHVWESDEVKIVSFVTSETLKALEKVASSSTVPVIVINPQWREADFGWGEGKKTLQQIVASFTPAYIFQTTQVRLGITAAVKAALQYTPQTKWQVFRVSEEDGLGECLASELPERPKGKDLEVFFKGPSDTPDKGGFSFGGFRIF